MVRDTHEEEGTPMHRSLVRGLASAATVAAICMPTAALAHQAAAARPDRYRPPLRCHAWVTNRQPADNTEVGVKVRTVRFAHMLVVAGGTRKRRTASRHGRRTVWFDVGDATPGTAVSVLVDVWRHGRKGACITYYTPQG
jgi:hypothetical protein